MLRCCATSTPSAPIRRGLIGEDPNGIPNNLVPYIAQVAVGKLREVPRLRQRLSHPGRHRRARLHPRGRPGPRPCGCHREAGGKARPVHLQPGHRPRLQRAGRHPCLRARPAARSSPTSSTRAAPATLPSAGVDPSKAKRELGWEAQYGIEEMCAHSWNWQSHNPDGYKTAK